MRLRSFVCLFVFFLFDLKEYHSIVGCKADKRKISRRVSFSGQIS